MQGFVFIVVFGIVAWYYYHRFRESEVEYYKLHKKMSEVKCENVHLKERISDLELYKQDVSKTFKILDNELLGINEHIKNRSIQQQTIPVRINDEDGDGNGEVEPSQRISILTPEMLGQLFHSMQNEQEHFAPVQNTSASVEEIKQDERGEQEHELTSTLSNMNMSMSNMNNFEKYLIE